LDTKATLLVTVLCLPLVGALGIALLGRWLKHRAGWLALVSAVGSTVALVALGLSADLGGRTVIAWPWIPTLGIELSFLVDGLSMFFGLIVGGMGCLVVFYAIHYLGDEYEDPCRFYAQLMLFMAAMLGTVLANDLMALFVFWELTGLASFLLIGSLHGEEAARVGARQALLVTSLTGLVMLLGLIMVRSVTGCSGMSGLLALEESAVSESGALRLALVLVLVGAFGKSAQFPFHFWLPAAMTAPTPVSAYLHSATMVKLGVFLCARLFPVFSSTAVWAPLLAVVGFTTLLAGAVMALLSHELKSILAFSTVSQLGFLVGYYGLGPVGGVEYDYLHVLNHVTYKGCLFMVVGVVMHATHQKDIRRIGGLFRRLPLLGTITLVAAASMAGLPGTTGFLSKEAMFKEIFASTAAHGFLGMYAMVMVVLSSLIKVAFSARLFVDIFLGPEPVDLAGRFHAPSFWMQLPALVLAAAALVFGLVPSLLNGPFQWLATAGLNQPPAGLALWHGFNRELAASVIVVVLGFLLYRAGVWTGWRWHRIQPVCRFDSHFERVIELLSKLAKGLTRCLQSDRPTEYLAIILGCAVVLVGGAVGWSLLGEPVSVFAEAWAREDVRPVRILVAVLIGLSVLGVILLRRWTTQLIALSVAGFLICLYFVLYRAPDLALTQILVESATLILILLLLGRFPASAELGEVIDRPGRGRQALNLAISIGVGLMITGFLLSVVIRPAEHRVGPQLLASSQEQAQGSNAVNTILVDFRGFDTLGEITVLVIAMLGCLGLLMRRKRTPTEYRLGPMGPPGFGVHREEGS